MTTTKLLNLAMTKYRSRHWLWINNRMPIIWIMQVALRAPHTSHFAMTPFCYVKTGWTSEHLIWGAMWTCKVDGEWGKRNKERSSTVPRLPAWCARRRRRSCPGPSWSAQTPRTTSCTDDVARPRARDAAKHKHKWRSGNQHKGLRDRHKPLWNSVSASWK